MSTQLGQSQVPGAGGVAPVLTPVVTDSLEMQMQLLEQTMKTSPVHNNPEASPHVWESGPCGGSAAAAAGVTTTACRPDIRTAPIAPHQRV